jgi:hypothetical protein
LVLFRSDDADHLRARLDRMRLLLLELERGGLDAITVWEAFRRIHEDLRAASDTIRQINTLRSR